MTGKITAALARREAEFYRAHGLHREARELYLRLLASSPSIAPAIKVAIEIQIQQIEGEVSRATESDERKMVLAEDIRLIRQGWGGGATGTDILVCAHALAQIGHHAEALVEFKQLLRENGPRVDLTDAIASSLVHLTDPQTLPQAARDLSAECLSGADHIAHFEFALAERIQAQGHSGHALSLFRALLPHKHWFPGIEHRIATLASAGAPCPSGDRRPPAAKTASSESTPRAASFLWSALKSLTLRWFSKA